MQKESSNVKWFESYSLNRQTYRQMERQTHRRTDRHDRKHDLLAFVVGNYPTFPVASDCARSKGKYTSGESPAVQSRGGHQTARSEHLVLAVTSSLSVFSEKYQVRITLHIWSRVTKYWINLLQYEFDSLILYQRQSLAHLGSQLRCAIAIKC